MEVAIKTPATGKQHFATKKGVIGTAAIATFIPALVPNTFNQIWGTVGLSQKIN